MAKNKKNPLKPLTEPAPVLSELSEAPRRSGYSEADDEEHTLFILQLRLRGLSISQMARATHARYNIGRNRTWFLLKAALENLRSERVAEAPYSKAEQSARLRNLLSELHQERTELTAKQRELRSEKFGHEKGQIAARRRSDLAVIDKRKTAVDAALLRTENLIADIEGTRDPMRVDVNVTLTGAIGAVIQNLTPGRMQELLESARRRRDLAELGAIAQLPVRSP